ncbi:hypothetical protein PAXINDRAFT_18377 [Paxillus involutus ATCC 200175]|uniref:Uncharacterized protein n=1 Tax=Paxillus involutus ATCC 200175 TaxID=664439 RepID=A0A0C9SZ21_PAXIN|nr:hypothetical protein PAXINDRAFT_18377 [Paxillus involutus ATCC 200175]
MRGNRGEERERDDDENQSVDGEVGTMQVEGVEGREGEGVEWRSKESGDSDDDDDDDRRGIIHPSIPKPKVRNEKRTLVRMKKKIQMQRGRRGQRDHYNETSKTERVSKEASSRQKKHPTARIPDNAIDVVNNRHKPRSKEGSLEPMTERTKAKE